jgi:heat shock protein HslJ
MPDDPDIPSPDPGDSPDTGQPRGFMVYLAIALIGILVFLVFFMNPMGAGATTMTAITENTWALHSFAEADGTAIAVPDGIPVTAKFSPDGKLTGSGDCMTYSARYMVHETGIVVSRVTTMSLACPGGNATAWKLRYIASIENAAFFRVNDKVLTFFGTDGKPLLVFSPARGGI